MPNTPIALVEFPADDTARAQRFWRGVLEVQLEDRAAGEGQGWQTHAGGTELGLHPRGRGPGDTVSLPYFAVANVKEALARVADLGGTVIHPSEDFAICKDSEGSPFGLTKA